MRATRKFTHFLRPYRLWAVLAPLLMVGSLIMAILTSPQLALLFVGRTRAGFREQQANLGQLKG